MEVDPNSLDPEVKLGKIYAMASVAFGVFSLCVGIIPACGTASSLLGILLGWLSLRIDKNNIAYAGIGLSFLGALITIIYFAILVWRNP